MHLEDAQDQARALLREVVVDDRSLALVYHADADGIASAALAAAAVERLGGRVLPLTPAKGKNVYDEAFCDEIAAAEPSAVLVLDTGSRAGAAWPGGRTVVVDHHPTDAAPDVHAFVHDEDAVATAKLVLALVAPVAEIEDRSWLAAIGVLGDRGNDARHDPIVARASARFGVQSLREVVALVNASGRAARPAPELALASLRTTDDPRTVAGGQGAPAAKLHEMRAEVAEAVKHARRVAPRVRGQWAIIELEEPCRIHGVIASSWARRLSPRIVLVANRGYVPGRVHLSVRSHLEMDLRAALRGLLPDAGADFAAGHARATGAIIDAATYERLLAAIT
jgi:single-stranded-DNA-specific exonuclease